MKRGGKANDHGDYADDQSSDSSSESPANTVGEYRWASMNTGTSALTSNDVQQDPAGPEEEPLVCPRPTPSEISDSSTFLIPSDDDSYDESVDSYGDGEDTLHNIPSMPETELASEKAIQTNPTEGTATVGTSMTANKSTKAPELFGDMVNKGTKRKADVLQQPSADDEAMDAINIAKEESQKAEDSSSSSGSTDGALNANPSQDALCSIRSLPEVDVENGSGTTGTNDAQVETTSSQDSTPEGSSISKEA